MTLELNLQKGLVGHWTMDRQDIDSGVLRDRSGYGYDGTINNPTTNDFGSSEKGYWGADVQQQGSIDGFKDVGFLQATDGSFDDLTTNEFNWDDYAESADNWYVYMAFAAKGDQIPFWGGGGDKIWIQKPTIDPNNYQLYIAKNDGNPDSFNGDYFRFYYDQNTSTPSIYVADPFVWTEDDEGENARIIGDSSARTVEPFTQGKFGDAFSFSGGSDTIENINSESIGTSSFSFSFWIKGDFADSSQNYPDVFNNFWGRGASDNTANDSGFRVDSDSTGRYIQKFAYDGEFPEWTHVALTVNQETGNAQFYENDKIIATDSFTAGENISDSVSFFGNDDCVIKISDFRYYKRHLSDDEIQALYNMRSQRNADI